MFGCFGQHPFKGKAPFFLPVWNSHKKDYTTPEKNSNQDVPYPPLGTSAH
jgi:hypothetical protein